MVEYLKLAIDELLLDEENPRLGTVGSQSEAIERIINISESHFRNLMISIRDNGLDPGDNLYVIKEDRCDDYIVLEGNRRLSSILVLNNPNLLDGTNISEPIKKSIVKICHSFDREKIEPIHCVLFEKRADANEWIYRRHTGISGGEGRMDWGPLDVQRFTGDRSVLDIIDFIGRNADYSDDDWERTRKTIESRKSSTISRIIDSAFGREFLNISILLEGTEKIPFLGSDPIWALSVLCKIIEDVRDGNIDSRGLNTSREIEEYFSLLPEEFQKITNVKCSPKAFREININDKKDQNRKNTSKNENPRAKDNTSAPKKKTTLTPKARITLAPKKHLFRSPVSTKGIDLLREAGKLDVNTFKISGAFVLRGFVELSINDYMENNNLAKFDSNSKEFDLTKKAESVLQHIVSKGEFQNSDFRGFRGNLLTKTSPSSIQSLNGFVHNKFQIPTPDALRAGWDCSVPLFIATYGKA